MNKVINFKEDYHQDPDYKKQLEEIREWLDDMHSEIQELATNLACVGAWKDWNDSKEEGDIVHFSDEALHDTQDPNVDALLGLCENINSLREKFNEHH